MKSIDALAKGIQASQPATTDTAPDLSKMSDALINKIADVVISKLSSAATPPEPDATDDTQTPEEGGEEGEHIEPDKVD